MVVLAMLAVGCLYASTAAPNAWWGDGPELACAVRTLGVPHPTGYPLYTIFFHLTTIGRAGESGLRLSIFSLAGMTFAIFVLFQFFYTFDTQASRERSVGPLPSARLGWALIAGLAIALSRTAWEHATFTEVYPLTFVMGCIFVAGCGYACGGKYSGAWPMYLGAVAGLLALNHYSAIAWTPLGVFVLMDWTRGRLRDGRAVIPQLIGGLAVMAALMCLGYLGLMLIARRNPPLNWGDPSNLERLWWVMSGGQFTQLKIGGGVGAGLARWLDWWGCQWLPGGLGRPASVAARPWIAAVGLAPLGVAVTGLALLARRRPAFGWGLLASIAMTALFGACYRIVDIDPYFLPALPAAGVGWIVAGRALADWIGNWMPHPTLLLTLALAALAMLAVSNHPWISKRGDEAPLIWGETVMKNVEEGALIVTAGDNDIYSLWYQQMVLGRRPDVTVLGSNFIFSGWYAKYFERPERPRIPVLIEERGVATGKLPFDEALIGGTILPNMREGRAVYVTFPDPTLDNYFAPQPVAQLLTQEYVDWFTARYLNTLPSPVLWRLTPNEGLMALDKTALRRELESFYRKHQPGEPLAKVSPTWPRGIRQWIIHPSPKPGEPPAKVSPTRPWGIRQWIIHPSPKGANLE
jgi:hypothetical protein